MMHDYTANPNGSKLLQIFAIAIATEPLCERTHINLSGHNLLWLPYEDFLLAVRYVTEVIPQSTESLLEYEAVVQFLHDTIDIIPMRFGTVLPASQIKSLMNDRQDQLKLALASVAGCSEMLLRWNIIEEVPIESPKGEVFNTEHVPPVLKNKTGSDYLKKKYRDSIENKKYDYLVLEAKQKVESIVGNSIQGIIARIMDVSISSLGTSPLPKRPIVALDLLVKKDRFGDVFQIAKAIELLGKQPILVRGPLPIFSFAESQLPLATKI